MDTECPKLVWSDEFDGSQGTRPSEDKWTYLIGDGSNQSLSGWGNQELQYYTKESAELDGSGHLVITASSSGASQYRCYYGPCQYTSARMATKFSARYGRIEARLKTTSGQGTWPAFWMLGTNIDQVGWPECGEIDIVEGRGSRPSEIGGAMHGPGYSGGKALGRKYTLANGGSFAMDFHVVALDWKPESVEWSVDGEVYFTQKATADKKWVFDRPFYMLVNLAVGGHYDGVPVDAAVFPQRYVIDYIRVYGLAENCMDIKPHVTTATTGRPKSRKNNAPVLVKWSPWNYIGLAGTTTILNIFMHF